MLRFARHTRIAVLLIVSTLLGVVPGAGPCAAGDEAAYQAEHRCCGQARPAERSCCSHAEQVQACRCTTPQEQPLHSTDRSFEELRMTLHVVNWRAAPAQMAGGVEARLWAALETPSLSSPLPRLQALLCCWLI